MICKKCGKELPDEVKFCGACGTPVASLSEFTSPAPQAAPAAPEMPEVTTEPATYRAPAMPNNYTASSYVPPRTEENKPLTVGQFLLMDLICAVPVLNLIMLVMWGFGAEPNATRKNWARSRLIWVAIGMAFVILMLILVLLGNSMY